jgi:N-acyl-L-homoserine lactone synthetase
METITPNRERTLRRTLRKARASMESAASEFLAARVALRAAQRAHDLVPVLDYRIGFALSRQNMRAANLAWPDRIGKAERIALHAALDRAEDALWAVLSERSWYRRARAAVRAIDSGEVRVEVGAAWSPRGLASFRACRR